MLLYFKVHYMCFFRCGILFYNREISPYYLNLIYFPFIYKNLKIDSLFELKKMWLNTILFLTIIY